jgi:radical SAM protein with 4Fe4S-binding SPASM domain
VSLQLQIETTSTCNARCHFCVYPEAKRWGGTMSMDLFKSIVDDTKDVPQIDTFVLHGLGEPLLDAKLEDRLWYIRQVKPGAHTEIYSNGVYLTPERFESLKKAGLTSLVVSLNAINQEQHEAIMGLKGKFQIVCDNLDYAIANLGGVHLQVHAVVNDDTFLEKHIFPFYERWGHRERGGYGMLIREGNWAGDNRTVRSFKPNEACGRALGQIYVLYDGKVATCCFDPTGKQVFGNLNTQSIREVYNGSEYLRFREAHAEDKADQYSICRSCTRI